MTSAHRVLCGSFSAAIGYPTEILNVMGPICGALMALFGLERALRPGGAVDATADLPSA